MYHRHLPMNPHRYRGNLHVNCWYLFHILQDTHHRLVQLDYRPIHRHHCLSADRNPQGMHRMGRLLHRYLNQGNLEQQLE